jgi:dihydroorotase
LQKAALSGNKKFFLGTDSAPHAIDKKESSCGCAGIFSAPYALQLYLDFFETHGALDKFEAFASHYGANFYGLAINQDTITLEKRPSHAAKSFPLGKSRVIPIAADEVLNWSLADD